MKAVERWMLRAMRALKLGFCDASAAPPARRSHRAVVQRQLQADAKRSARLALDRDAGSVAAERVGVAFDPLDAFAEVEQAVVARALLGLLSRREES